MIIICNCKLLSFYYIPGILLGALHKSFLIFTSHFQRRSIPILQRRDLTQRKKKKQFRSEISIWIRTWLWIWSPHLSHGSDHVSQSLLLADNLILYITLNKTLNSPFSSYRAHITGKDPLLQSWFPQSAPEPRHSRFPVAPNHWTFNCFLH